MVFTPRRHVDGKRVAVDSALLPSLLVYASIVLVYIGLFYRETIRSIIVEMVSPTYSYLVVVVFSLSIISYMIFKNGEASISRSVPLLRLFASSLLASLSILLYIVSLLSLQYELQIKMLSLILLSLSFATILLRFHKHSSLILVFTLLALIPLPTSLLDNISIELSKITGRAVAFLEGLTYSETPLGVFLEIITPRGRESLAVTFACSGIVSLSSVIATLPVTAYIVAREEATLLRKIMALLASATIAVATVFSGNIARIMLVVQEAQKSGVNHALELFHQSPSAIYVSIAILASILVALRLSKSPKKNGQQSAWPREERRNREEHSPWPSGVLAVFVFFSLFFLPVFGYALGATNSPSLHEEKEVPVFKELLAKPSIIFRGSGVKVVSSYPDKKLADLLGETNLVRILVEYNKTRYSGYIEIAESPSRFHSWVVCLGYQGYRVVKEYSLTKSGFMFKIYSAVRGQDRYILAYTVFKIKASFGSAVYPAYIKLTLMKRVGEREESEIVKEMVRILSLVIERSGSAGLAVLESIGRATIITYYSFGFFSSYLVLSLLLGRKIIKRRIGLASHSALQERRVKLSEE